jgi:hypothetical protein
MNIKEAHDKIESMYCNLTNLLILLADDGNQTWEQPKITCKRIDLLAMEIRDLLPGYSKAINNIMGINK